MGCICNAVKALHSKAIDKINTYTLQRYLRNDLLITTNPAVNFKLKNKGSIKIGYDADLVLLDTDLEIDTVIAKGQLIVKDKKIIVTGMFEKS